MLADRIAPMLVRLTRLNRARAGRLVALLYLLCVLAPGAALALGGPAAWIPAEIENKAATHAHDHSDHGSSHQHGSAHDPADTEGVRHQQDGNTSPGPCCAMHCLSAIAADLPAIVKPKPPRSIRLSEKIRSLRGTMPPPLYRPPNA